MKTPQKVFIFSPHPDDFLFFMGGTFLHHLKENDSVTLVQISAGERGQWPMPKSKRAAFTEVRMNELKASVTGLKEFELIFLNGEDRNLKNDPHLGLYLKSTPALLQADLVYLPEYQDSLFFHSDHQAVGQQVQKWLKENHAKAQIRYFHSTSADLVIEVDEDETELKERLRLHQSQYSFFAYPPFLLYYGEWMRRRYLKKIGRETNTLAEGFRLESQ